MKILSKFLILGLCLVPGILTTCSPSPYILQKHAYYNFTDEGFLSPGILQTIGRAKRQVNSGGSRISRQLCLESALDTAVRRTLSVFLHTHYNIEASQTNSLTRDFKSDYPLALTDSDYLRAELDFRPLLKKGFIALQDARSREACIVVFRIILKDLSKTIRETKVTFKPSNYGRRKKARGRDGDKQKLESPPTKKESFSGVSNE